MVLLIIVMVDTPIVWAISTGDLKEAAFNWSIPTNGLASIVESSTASTFADTRSRLFSAGTTIPSNSPLSFTFEHARALSPAAIKMNGCLKHQPPNGIW